MRSIINKIYYYSPVILQNFIITIYGLKLIRERYGFYYKKKLNYYLNIEKNNIEQLKKIQLQEFKSLLKNAKEKSKFYSELYQNINVDDINTLECIKKLPIVDKEDVRKNINDIYTIPKKDSLIVFTGGTTGKSLEIRYTKQDLQHRAAKQDAWKTGLGINPFKDKKATFSGNHISHGIFQKNIFWRDNLFYRQRVYSTFDLSPKNIGYYINNLNIYKPQILNGFVSAIYLLAKYAGLQNLSINFKPKAIFLTSETLLDFQRITIEKFFNSKVYNEYGSGEGSPYITECEKGNLHYNITTGIIENIKFDDEEEMVITSFRSNGTPLIRYRIGDKLNFKDGKCECGNINPLVRDISGRKVDFLYSEQKGPISLSHLSDVIKGMPNCVQETQFIQKNINFIIVKLVIDKKFFMPEHENKIMSQLKYRFGTNMKIELQYINKIDRTDGGKFQLIINEIN
tara:strand:+ start:603 stop:1970 length:1368 start_codon:yes stop_codon:yes gene_type:complete